MDNYTNNNIDELALMRSQLEELKARLDREVKINESNVRKLLKSNMGFINKYLVFAWISFVIVSLMFLGVRSAFGFSWALVIVSILGVGIDAYCDTRFNRMKNSDIESMSMVEMGEKLLWMKRMRRRQLIIGLPLTIIWVVWLLVEIYLGLGTSLASQYPGMIEGALVGGIVGAIVGFPVCFMIYRRMQHDTDNVLEQIKSLKETE